MAIPLLVGLAKIAGLMAAGVAGTAAASRLEKELDETKVPPSIRSHYASLAHRGGECIACGSCEDECPVGAITEGEDKYVIDAKLCTDCGACCDQCPVEAIVPGEEK